MSLRNKLLTAMLIVFVFYLLLIYSSLKVFVIPVFERLEMAEARQDLQRGVESVQNNIFVLGKLVLHWAHWDDSYQFVFDK
ncbi:hypothetical protein, partial [Piscirickettsia litoralis]|uniref:hypothetical protein n=1 Tax=Piscirickettsia litoralis TaxID=1891921 RepID=UPI001911E6E4